MISNLVEVVKESYFIYLFLTKIRYAYFLLGLIWCVMYQMLQLVNSIQNQLFQVDDEAAQYVGFLSSFLF